MTITMTIIYWDGFCSMDLVRDLDCKVAGGRVARLPDGWSGVLIPARGRNFSFLQIVQAGLTAHLVSYLMGTEVLCRV
jgi:hypothetical protein